MTAATQEAAVVEMIGTAFTGGNVVSATAPATEPEVEVKYDFDLEFQSRIVYLSLYDESFMRRTQHLLKPSYFESAAHAALMSVILKHWQNYETILADQSVAALAIKNAVDNKQLRKEAAFEATKAFKEAFEQRKAIQNDEATPLNAEFIADQVAAFAKRQAMIEAVSKAVVWLDDPVRIRDVQKLITDAAQVGLNEVEAGGDYFERLKVRTNERADESVGKRPPRGITTGHPKLDALLYHRGFGRKELTVLMGGAKAGKTMALIDFASAAVMAGYNVLYVTLEVSNRIVEERVDARFSEIRINDLVSNFGEVNDRIGRAAAKEGRGRFYISEYPSGTMSPSMLRSLLERHKAKGWTYDMVVVDYADIMAPDYRTQDAIENSKQIYVSLRAIATEWNCAMLTATQSNREGFKAVTAKADNVADDFNKVRTADLFISINSTEDERRDGKARLYFAASRNQQSGMTVFIEQDLAAARFLKMVEKVE